MTAADTRIEDLTTEQRAVVILADFHHGDTMLAEAMVSRLQVGGLTLMDREQAQLLAGDCGALHQLLTKAIAEAGRVGPLREWRRRALPQLITTLSDYEATAKALRATRPVVTDSNERVAAMLSRKATEIRALLAEADGDGC